MLAGPTLRGQTSYGRGSWPVTTFFNSFGQPVIPWFANISATEMPMDFDWVVASENGGDDELGALSGSPEEYAQ